jgi:hypothetical protein
MFIPAAETESVISMSIFISLLLPMLLLILFTIFCILKNFTTHSSCSSNILCLKFLYPSNIN